MSARQSKKQRKGRNNANNRERTVTTLTGDPDVPFPVPSASEEVVSQPILTMPSTFAGTSAGNKLQNVVMGPQPYPMTGSYNGFGFNGTSFGPAMSNIHQQQPPHPFLPSTTMPPHHLQKPPLPPGKNDLEILQNLKNIILENQHPFFRPVPQPAALAALYKGSLTSSSQNSTEVQSEERSGSGIPEAPSDGNAVPPPVSGSSDTSSADASRNNVEEGDQHLSKSLGLQDQLPTVNQLDRYENSSGSNIGSSLVETTSMTEKPDLIPSTVSGSRSAEPPASENAAHERYDPHSPALWGPVKTEPVDDPMVGRDPPYTSKGDLQQTENWNPYGSYSENGPSDLDRKPSLPAAPTSSMNNRPSGDDRGPNNNSRGSGWQDRNRRQSYDRLHDNRQNPPRRQSSNIEAYYDGPNGRRGQGDDFSPRRPPGDARRANGSLGRYPSMSDTPNDVRPSDDLRARPASRVPLISRIETDEAVAMGNNSSISTQAMEPPSIVPVPSAVLNHPAVSDNQAQPDRTNIPSRHSTGDITSLPPGDQGPQQRNFQHHKKRFNNRNQPGGATHGPPYNNNIGGQHYEPPLPRPGYGRPPSPGPPPHSGNSFRGRSASTEGRGARVPPSPSRGGRDYRGPQGRAVSRDRGASTYRPDYDSDVPPRYGDNRPPVNRYSPPPGGDRGRPGAYSPPRPGSASGREWNFGAYPATNRRDWNGIEENTYKPRANWESPPPGDRERYDRDYQPRPAGWEARGDREYPARDNYPAGLPPPPDDRYVDRPRPAPQSGYPNYNNRRQRSASPPRRTGPGIVDERPPMKRPREDYPLGDFYQPPPPVSGGGGGRDGVRRPNEYVPPPRTGSPGPLSGAGSSWPPPSSASSNGPSGVGPPPDRDYRMADRMGGYPPAPPPSGGYDRQRSSPGHSGRGNYNNRGGYGGGRGGYNNAQRT